MNKLLESCIYSEAIDPRSTHPQPDEYFGILPVHVSRYTEAADQASTGFLDKWKEAIKLDGLRTNGFEFHGCHTPFGNLVSLAYPEALPDRVALCAEITQFALFWDDVADALSKEQNAVITQDLAVVLLKELNPTEQNGAKQHELKLQISKLIVSVLREVLEKDREAGLAMVNSWKGHLVSQAKSTHNSMSFEDYKMHRMGDVALEWAIQIACWASDIHPTDDDKLSVKDFIDSGMARMQFINDYYSFSKEFTEHQQAGTLNRMQNGLGLLMREYGYTEDEARSILRQEILQGEQAIIDGYHSWEERVGLTQDARVPAIRQYIATAILFLGGATYYTSLAPRYNRQDMKSTPEQRASLIGTSHRGLRILEGYPPPKATTRLPAQLSSQSHTPVINGAEHNLGKRRLQDQEEIHQTTGKQNGVNNSSWTWASVHTAPFRRAPSFACGAPFNYINSLQGKKFRNKLIDALNTWLSVNPESLELIKCIIDSLHNSSLMLDDIEDGSMLRRGQPATHIVYGTSQTINSANFAYIQTVQDTLRLSNPECINIFIDELTNLHRGQALDLYWRFHRRCPTPDDYIIMVDNKTGGLFRLLYRLMEAESSHAKPSTSLATFLVLCGRYFQIHNDYISLASAEYTTQKGYCEDLDEGKFSLLIIHLLSHTPFPDRITGVLFNRTAEAGGHGLTREAKDQLLQAMEASGTFVYVRGVLEQLYAELMRLYCDIEAELGDNPAVQVLLLALKL